MSWFGQIPRNQRYTDQQLKVFGYLGVERRRVPSSVSWVALACFLGAIACLVALVFSFIGSCH